MDIGILQQRRIEAAFAKGIYEEMAAEIGAELVSLVQDGTFVSPVEARYPLAAVADALHHQERPGRRGKILLVSPPLC